MWRIFLETADSDDRVTAVFAAGGNTLVIGSSGGAGIINNQFGSVTGEQLLTNMCDFVPDLCLDSYVTIGHAGEDLYYDGTSMSCGEPVTPLSTSPSPTIIEDSFGTNPLAPNLAIDDGTWFTIPVVGCEDASTPYGPNNKVLIAQVAIPIGTTLEYYLNVQIMNDGDPNQTEQYVWNPNTATDGQIYLSALANPPIIEDLACCEPGACNYDSIATMCDPSYCVWPGCLDPEACNYDSAAGCDDGDACIYPGCGDPNACNYDSTAECIDFLVCWYGLCNDEPEGAYPLNSNAECDFETGLMSGATVTEGVESFIFGGDVWYSFEATSTTYSICVITDDFDCVLNVYDSDLNLVEFEDQVFVNGPENLFSSDFIIGQTYYISVGAFNLGSAQGDFGICIVDGVDYTGQCEAPPGDFDSNGNVSTSDLLVMLGNIGCTGDCVGDLDGDNIVTIADILIFLGLFGG